MSSNVILAKMIEESAKYIQLAPDRADPLQLWTRTQIAPEYFPMVVKSIWNLRNIAMSAKSPKLRRILLQWVYTYLYTATSTSSIRGQFLKILHSKQESISLLSKDFKSPSIKDAILHNKASQAGQQEDTMEFTTSG